MNVKERNAQAAGPTPALLAVVAAGLLVLLGSAVAVLLVPHGWWRPVLGMTIAAAKALLIVLYFMRARFERGNLPLFIGGSLVWVALLFGLTLSDYLTR